MATKPAHIYQFKISLDYSKPPIWRRIQVPENYTMWDLHVAIQDAMGWDDSHLHEFNRPQSRKASVSEAPERVGIPPDEDWGFDDDVTAGWDVKIRNYFSLDKNKALYTYDFGDGWEHTILLEKILPAATGIKYPVCIAGERACPPEDCGGVPGYEYMLEILQDPQHEEYEETLSWLGESFDPDNFNPEMIKFSNPKTRLKNLRG